MVDGLQRVSTLVQYFDADPQLVVTSVPHYKDLSEDEKRDFLQYDVSVRDLGAISKNEIIEIFQRIMQQSTRSTISKSTMPSMRAHCGSLPTGFLNTISLSIMAYSLLKILREWVTFVLF